MKKFKYTESLSDTDCEIYDEDRRTEWSYAYSPGGERQQKRMTFNPNGDKGGFVYPWVYYLLGGDNKQHAVYHGVQLFDSLIIKSKGLLTQLSEVNPQKKYYTRPCLDYYSTLTGSATSKAVVYMYPVEYNVFGGGSSANLTYKYDSLTASWKKYFNIYDHLGNVRSVVRKNASDYTITGQFDYHPFGNVKWNYSGANAKDQRTTWIGKEKDVAENDLGDFGVRKYEYETGRFLQVDPLSDKYKSWNTYQYSMNNPVALMDAGGQVVVAKSADDRKYMVKDLTEIFEDAAPGLGFSFNSSNELQMSGAEGILSAGEDVGPMTMQQSDLYGAVKGISDLIGSTEKTQVVYEDNIINPETGKEYQNKYNNVLKDKASNYGGEATYTMADLKKDKIINATQNTIFITPGTVNTSSTFSGYVDPRRFRLMHGFGHVLHQNNKQGKVIDYENKARRIEGKNERSYDEKHPEP